MGPFFCFMVQRFSQQWGVWFNNAIIAFSIWTNSRGYKNSEKLMSHAWRLLMPVYSTFFTFKDSSAHQRSMWVPSTSVTLLEVVKMNCARARIGNLCSIFSEKKLITEHTCDYCRLEFTKILWHFHGQVQPQSAAPFASFMSTNLSVYSSCWISNWTIPSITRRKQLAINRSLLLMGPAKTSCQFTALHSCALKSCRDLPNPPQTSNVTQDKSSQVHQQIVQWLKLSPPFWKVSICLQVHRLLGQRWWWCADLEKISTFLHLILP